MGVEPLEAEVWRAHELDAIRGGHGLRLRVACSRGSLGLGLIVGGLVALLLWRFRLLIWCLRTTREKEKRTQETYRKHANETTSTKAFTHHLPPGYHEGINF